MTRYIITCLAAMLCTAGLWAQTRISGTVRDENGAPMPGATVVVRGTTNGVTTDGAGAFSIPDVKPDDILQVGFIGYLTKEVGVGTSTTIEVTLEPDAYTIEDVVAIGYGTTARRDLTGAVGSISAADIVKTATSNYDQALAGRIAGVQVSSVDGTPGEGLNIVIRGGNSITGDNSPLYVVDGIPYENFDAGTLSSSDIKSIDVLKDASSAAIYGSRGANGVVLITTKSGRTDGRTDISVSAQYGVSWIPTRIEVLGPYDYVRYQREVAYASDGYNPGEKVRGFYNTWGDDIEIYRGMKGTSWQDEIFRTASFSKANVTVSGGNETTSIYYSGEYLDQQGTLLNSGYMKMINNLRVVHRIGQNTKLTGQIQYTYNKSTGINVSGNSYTSIIRDALQYRPIEPINSDGFEEGGYDPEDASYKYLYNPIKNLRNTDRKSRSNIVRGVMSLERSFGKNWKANLNGNFQSNDTKSSTFYGEETQSGLTGVNGINGTITNRRNYTFSGSATLTYNYRNKKHKVDALGGFEATRNTTENNVLSNSQLPTDIFGIDKIQLGTSPGIPTSYKGGNALASFFGRVNYTYGGRYLFTVNMRADGSSKFAKDNRWGYFPSFSAAWRIDQEEFLKGTPWINSLKLRGGWGLTGNNRIGDFDYISYLDINSGSGYVWGNGEQYIPGAVQANLGVPNLKWETTAQTSAGLDVGLFQNRVTVTADWYYKKTSDLLLNADMALSTGFNRVQQNVGKISNRGFEFTLNTVNIDKKNFQWSSSFNISFNKNKVLKLNDGQEAIYTNPGFYYDITEYSYITQVGRPVGLIYGLKFDGIYSWDDFNYDSSTGTFTLKDGIPDNGGTVAPGSPKFVDRNKDGTINELDRVVIGDLNPKHFGGFTNDFIIGRNFDVSIFFQWSYGGDILNATKAVMGVAENRRYNILSSAKNFWTPYHQSPDVNGVRYETIFGAAPKGNQIDSRHVEDGSYLRLKSLTVGYTLPARAAQKIRMNKVRVYLSAQNLWTLTGYSGYDPDVSVGKYGALTPRLDYSAYPQSSIFIGGLEFTF